VVEPVEPPVLPELPELLVDPPVTVIENAGKDAEETPSLAEITMPL
jgi:hypothetical protein